MVSIKVSKNEAGQRFDKLLIKIFNKTTAAFIFKMLRKKNITLNGKKATGSEHLAENDEIKLFISDDTLSKFSDRFSGNAESVNPGIKSLKKDEIVYEDTDILIVNKPVGELSQKAEGSDVSINERIAEYLKDSYKNESFKPSVCNRIDRNTSGLIIAGKSLLGLQRAAELLRNHKLKKYYLCIAAGSFDKRMHLKAYIKKDEKTNKVQVQEAEKEGFDRIEAEYIPLIASKDYTFLAVRLITGKPHQIRAHMASLGHVLLGDSKYGFKQKDELKIRHQLLHAFLLKFPDDESVLKTLSGKTVKCMPPAEFMKILDKLFTKEKAENAILEFERTEGLGA